MTATTASISTLNRNLDCKRTSYRLLKTPTLRREVKELEAQLRIAKHAFKSTPTRHGGKRHHGQRLSQLLG